MTCYISPTLNTLRPGYSYLSSYRQDFQHLLSPTQRNLATSRGLVFDAQRRDFSSQTQRTFPPIEAQKGNSFLQALSDKYFARSPPRPSMVKLGSEPQQETSSSRSAGQATSPQTRATEANPTPAPCRVSTSVDSTQTHGQFQEDQLPVSSVRDMSPVMESDVDFYSSCPSSPDTGSRFSTRATTPEDDGDDDLSCETILARKKREIVDSNMKFFAQLCYWWYIRNFGVVECAGGKRKRTTDQSGSDPGRSNSNKETSPDGHQKRQFNDDGQGDGLAPDDKDDGNDDGDGNRATGKKRAKRDLDQGLKFACPFFKHDSSKYGSERTCCGPGWDNVHRVKEHLFRRHQAPRFVCHRCNEAFRTEDLYRTHQRAATPCSLQEPCPPDGFDEAKERQLRTRQKKTPQITEREKWQEVYAILFPDDLMPSPYHDKAETRPGGLHDSEEMARYEQYLHRELLPKVRHEMEREVNAELNAVGDRMRTKTMDMAQSMALRMFQTCWAQGFHQLPRPSVMPPPPGSPPNSDSGFVTPEPVAVPLSVEQLHVPFPSYDAGLLDGVAVMENDGFSFDPTGVEFLDQVYDFTRDENSEIASFPDPAYGNIWDYSLENCATSTV